MPRAVRRGGGPRPVGLVPRHETDGREQGDRRDQRAHGEDRPVGVEAGVDLDPAHRSDRHRRRCQHRADHREQHAAENRDRGCDHRRAGDQVRVGAERPRRFLVLAPAAQVPCECLADEDESREPHDDAEHTECQRDRPCRLHRMERVRRRHPKELRATGRVRGDRLLDRRDVGVAVAQHEALPCVELETFRLLHERGREQDERGPVGVVLCDLFDERTDADDRRVDEQAGLRVLQQCRIRILDVVSAHDAEIDALTDVVAVPPRGLFVDDDFVCPRRVREPPLDRCEAILVEVTPVDAADRLEVLGEIGSVHPARDVERGVGAGFLHLGQVGDRIETRVASGIDAADVDGHRRGVGGTEEARIRRLRPPGSGDREHREPARQPEQQRDADQRGPTPPAGRTRPVCREPHTPSSNPLQPMRTPWTRRRACNRVGVPPPVRDHVRDAGPMTLGRESTTDEVLDGVDLSGQWVLVGESFDS